MYTNTISWWWWWWFVYYAHSGHLSLGTTRSARVRVIYSWSADGFNGSPAAWHWWIIIDKWQAKVMVIGQHAFSALHFLVGPQEETLTVPYSTLSSIQVNNRWSTRQSSPMTNAELKYTWTIYNHVDYIWWRNAWVFEYLHWFRSFGIRNYWQIITC